MGQPGFRHARWSPARKAAVVLAWLRGWDAGELAHLHGLTEAHLLAWVNRFLAGGQAALKTRQVSGGNKRDHQAHSEETSRCYELRR